MRIRMDVSRRGASLFPHVAYFGSIATSRRLPPRNGILARYYSPRAHRILLTVAQSCTTGFVPDCLRIVGIGGAAAAVGDAGVCHAPRPNASLRQARLTHAGRLPGPPDI